MCKRTHLIAAVLLVSAVLAVTPQLALCQHPGGAEPNILPIRARAELVHEITLKRLDTLNSQLIRPTQ